MHEVTSHILHEGGRILKSPKTGDIWTNSGDIHQSVLQEWYYNHTTGDKFYYCSSTDFSGYGDEMIEKYTINDIEVTEEEYNAALEKEGANDLSVYDYSEDITEYMNPVGDKITNTVDFINFCKENLI